MSLSYKTTSIVIDGFTWNLRQFDSRDQVPTESDKDLIGRELWGESVAESLWPLSGILWPAGIILAELVSQLSFSSKKVLEIGCGLALASLVLHRRGVDVTASDYNTFAGELLRENAKLNNLEAPKFKTLSWQQNYSGDPYDVIIGSDVLYEPGCEKEVCQFLMAALGPHGAAIFVDPGRAHVRKFETTMQAAGFSCEVEWPIRGQKTRILRIVRGG
jgi:predicted nicotinamide N-methyase